MSLSLCPRWRNLFIYLTALLWLDTCDSVRLSEASIIGLFVWQRCIPNTNQANSIWAFGPKAQMRVAWFVFGLHVCRTNGQRYLPLITVVIKLFGHFTEIGPSRCREVYQNSMTLFVSAAICDTRVIPPTTSRVTLAGVTRITPGNPGQGNSVLAVNRVVDALGCSSLCCLDLWRHNINEFLGIAVRFDAFRGFCFIKTRFSNLDINVT